MNQAITMMQVLNWDGTNYVYLNDCLNKAIKPYLTLYNNETNYTNFINKYKDFIIDKLELSLQPINQFQSLYDLDTSQAMLLKLVNDKVQELLTKAINSKLMLDNTWDDFNNIGSDLGDEQNTIGYSGYDVNNQQSDYQTNNRNTKNISSTSRLQYIEYLNTTTNNFVEIFVKDMIKLMCRIIY